MKKSIWTRVILVMTVLALIVVTACKQPTAGSVPVTGISLDTTELSLAVGESADLKVTVEPADATEKTVTWNAEPAGIVKVTPGKDGCFTLRGLNSGNAVFSVTAGGRTADCIVSVSSLRLDRTAASLFPDETVDLTASVSENGTKVNWSVEPAGVVTIIPQGDVCTVIPVDNGTVTVTASAGPAKAVCTVDSRVFVDDAFVAAVEDQCSWTKESDGRVKLTAENREAMAAVTKLNLNGKGLTDLSDIEWFTGLTTLNCLKNSLTELDVSNCTALEQLGCHSNQLSTLDVSANTALIQLSCYDNRLTSLDVSACTSLGSTFVCGAQTSDGTTPQTLILTLTADQKTKWDSEWWSRFENDGVNPVVKE